MHGKRQIANFSLSVMAAANRFHPGGRPADLSCWRRSCPVTACQNPD
jgi:hypothetical protein